ncbi:ABC transporter permease [Bacillus velezensis]|nr:ABC transporter permease [Bacillus velezensis]
MTAVIHDQTSAETDAAKSVAIFATISAPLLLTYFFSFSADGSQQKEVYVADEDQSAYSAQFMKMIQTAGHIKVTKVTEDVLKTKVNHQDISFGLLIGSHFEETLFSGDELNVSFIQNEEKGDAVLTEATDCAKRRAR